MSQDVIDPLHIKSHFNVSSIKSPQYLNAIVVGDCGCSACVASPLRGDGEGRVSSAHSRMQVKTPHLGPLLLPKGEASKAGRLLHFSKLTVKEPYL
jgi:hypothetical protein